MDAYIIGSGMIKFGKYPDKTVRTMAIEAIQFALDDAGLDKKDIEYAFFSNTFWGMFSNQHSIKGEVVFRSFGIGDIPVVNVENACAGASTALHMAYLTVLSGACDVAIAVGSEKITSEDKMKSLSVYASCMDMENFKTHMKEVLMLQQTFKNLVIPHEAQNLNKGRSVFMDVYAVGARWHMDRYGSTQKQLAVIAAKNHWHSSMNPLAQYQIPMTPEMVLNDEVVVWPLTRSMCAPVGDGAAAAIVVSERFLKKHGKQRAIRICASVLGQGRDRNIDDEDLGKRLGKKAYEKAGISPEDIDVAELHDATAYGELHQSENLGFCKEGEGGIIAERGETKLGGRIPINTSGGLESRGHPIGASGLAQIHEIVLQLRGEAGKRQVENAKIGLAQNGGGNIGLEEAVMGITILEKA
ncbi:propanoyl-CoA C-acyltransferase [Thermotomaculum hydrothermale]|uniref:Propanoyl-CoA C-acyltransferase n=1 Tax=Thermotomaculum hydrothermale TaxID=981385 RepID=A0A7R6SZD5_9BACT|nr:thiolase family protein [Thermotomaculum hydrothermale]BBB33625.1 propanoyl-CoA C-acyltransferase [Thermotomaculum hydrothermale]